MKILWLVLALSVSVKSFSMTAIRIYGKPGTFGNLENKLSTGEPVTKIPLDQMQVPPGNSLFFMASATDGTVFSANFHQNGGNLTYSGCYMAVTCANPSAKTCYDSVKGEAAHFSTIYVKTMDGFKSIPHDESLCLSPSTTSVIRNGAPDITDIERIEDESGTEHIVFISSTASFDAYPATDFPAMGFISKINGTWKLNESKQYSKQQISNSTDLAKTLCANKGCDGWAEMAFLPQSKKIAITGYFQSFQGVLILDLNGVVQAQVKVPKLGNRCTAEGGDLVPWTGYRQIDVDPTSTYGNEKMVIVVDGVSPFSHPVQEFKYDDRDKSLKPVSNLITTVSGSEPLPDCTAQGQNGNYDKYGNLIIGAFSKNRSVYHVFKKNPITNKSSLEETCPFTGYNEQNLGVHCTADFSIGTVNGRKTDGSPTWGYSFHNSNTQSDLQTSAIARLNGNGTVDLLDVFNSEVGPIYVNYEEINLNTGSLPHTAPHYNNVVWKGTLNPTSKSFWVPVASLVGAIDPTCSPLLFCNRPFSLQTPAWLYEIKYEDILNKQFRAIDARVSQPEIQRDSLKLIKFSVASKSTDAPGTGSGFWLYPKESTTPVYANIVKRGFCDVNGCIYKSVFRQNSLSELPPGPYRWSLVINSAETGNPMHVQGSINIQ